MGRNVRVTGENMLSVAKDVISPGIEASFPQVNTSRSQKAKGLIIGFRIKEMTIHTPVYLSGAEVEQVNSFRFLGISITKNLSWSSHISTQVLRRNSLCLVFLIAESVCSAKVRPLVMWTQSQLKGLALGSLLIPSTQLGVDVLHE
ncbi:hypothetical protein L3Q82_004560 [Scortum barcoo]|uniref:Uncharacterized protein n=1 Tax=Scortum barcoo TaxID=214431 RepID=A0ACB8VI08_9TELE|nr:hypothetical protein L3Q82_004560 [Scortum barcoo]